MEADVGDQQRFPARPIPADGDALALPEAAKITIDAVPVGAAGRAQDSMISCVAREHTRS
jgi:hypothetical protein